ncbi:glycosyltransferase family 76 protein [Aulographum hederae CBS 113979]|uniref:GPI mannosyltransferase 2 n=1 Tax=Aulographum hederae CBS 113979 TaxID=1176131 RepID=A0A6G1GTP3_9PEZI|nr:glycosyltransferase family 76 protein [Aulographum hederae CBS 113979]
MTLNRPVQTLILLFIAWKTCLLLVVSLSPGPGYDSSTDLLFGQFPSTSRADQLLSKLVRWDAVYFTNIAERGYQYEQEWAFGWGWTKSISGVAQLLPSSISALSRKIIAGTLLATLSHFLSVFVLYHLILSIFQPTCRPAASHEALAFTTAALHVCSPAGVFMLAPYGEASTSLLSFVGLLLYTRGAWHDMNGAAVGFGYLWLTIAAGISFGLATTIRSNGILYGIPFLWDFLAIFSRPRDLFTASAIFRLTVLGISGLAVAVGFVLPQWTAYTQYCYTDSDVRPWCTKLPPSIYTFVQEHYWNVGFLHYWTLSNIPLFLLASPILILLISTSTSILFPRLSLFSSSPASSPSAPTPPAPPSPSHRILLRLALPQLILAILVLTSFHVQIINRICSAYPVWYLAVAARVVFSGNGIAGESADRDELQGSQNGKVVKRDSSANGTYKRKMAEWIFRGSVIYAFVQAGLYASFLPPA